MSCCWSLHPAAANPDPNHHNENENGASLSAALSSLGALTHLCRRTFQGLPSLLGSRDCNSNLVGCPFSRHHLIPPHSLFRHSLRCPSSPRPHVPPHLLPSPSYPHTLHSPQPSPSPSSHLSLSFHHYLPSASRFFYRDCPAVFTFSHPHPLPLNTTFTLPPFLSRECLHSLPPTPASHIPSPSALTHFPILPSHFWAIQQEAHSWTHFPPAYSSPLLLAILALPFSNHSHLSAWILPNSPSYGLLIDPPLRHHIFFLFSLCLNSILTEAFHAFQDLNTQLLQLDWATMTHECPVLGRSLAWFTSHASILYGPTRAKLFVLDFFKASILDAASALLLFSSAKPPTQDPPLRGKLQNEYVSGMDMKEAKFDIAQEGNAHCGQTSIAAQTVCSCNVSVSQVAAAIAALHERSLLEDTIKGLWFPQQPNKFQLLAEHCYLTEKANEERKKRPDYRAVIEYDGLPRQESSNMGATGVKTREELLAEERDYKRRRMSYRGKKIKRSTVQVMRDIIEEYMEDIKQVEGVGSPMKETDESGMMPLNSLSYHDRDIETKIFRKGSHESSAVTARNPDHYEQKSQSNYCNKGKAVEVVEDISSRDYEQPRQGHSRKHGNIEDHWNTAQRRYGRKYSSRSPEGPRSFSPSNDSMSRHRKHEYLSRKRYDQKSRSRDRWQQNSHRNHDYDSSAKDAFEDRYDPSESLDVHEDDVSFGTK